jgi:hypothetical protein
MSPQRNGIDVAGATLPDRLVSRDIAAEYLGLSPATLASWASAGCGPRFTKLSAGRSGCVRYRLSELEKFVSDPQAYRPRVVTQFNKPEALKRGGNPALSLAKARRRRGKGARGI